MRTIEVFGMQLPVIKDLPEGFFLVAHKNGPAIASTQRGHLIGSLEHQDEEIPDDVRASAIEAFVEAAWPLIKARHYPPESPSGESAVAA